MKDYKDENDIFHNNYYEHNKNNNYGNISKDIYYRDKKEITEFYNNYNPNFYDLCDFRILTEEEMKRIYNNEENYKFQKEINADYIQSLGLDDINKIKLLELLMKNLKSNSINNNFINNKEEKDYHLSKNLNINMKKYQ